MSGDDQALDGNAAAGLLAEIFAFDCTTARAVCAGCGDISSVGELHAYALELGAILRCPGCGGVVARISRLAGGYWVDLQGMTTLRVSTTQ